MRKWMRERLQRRKKTPAEPADQPAPPPLQPAYFDAAEQPGPAPDPGHIASEVSAPSEPEARKMHSARSDPEEQAQADSAEQPAISQTASRPGQLNRSRRRRGGRGRGGRGREQAVAQAFAPAAVKGSIPVVPGEEEFPDDGDAEEPRATPSAAAAPRVPSTPAAPQRPPKGVVVLAIGLPEIGRASCRERV